jgi:iron complex outermembrane recepter protein
VAAAGLLVFAAAGSAWAQVVVAEPLSPIIAPRPEGAPPIEVQVVLQLVVDNAGKVESAVETSRVPASAPDSFAEAAMQAVKAAKFAPSTRDGQPIRSRIEYVVVFSAPAPPEKTESPAPSPSGAMPAVSTNEQDEDYAEVTVRGAAWASPRGAGDVRVKRELIEAAPRARTSEMLSAAPGFFVDHEDGEGFGDEVYLRGFDLSHGSGIEMRVGSIPINIPTHVQGQGYADVNFVIPEVVRSVRVLEGPYDPRQGDSAIVGSAYFDLGVPERGYQLKTTYGSFRQARLVAIAAPAEADEETFAAFSLRKTGGFGDNRAAQSGSAMGQYEVKLGDRDSLKLLATAYGAHATLAGVVRGDDVDAGRIGFYDSYPNYTRGQGLQASRVILGADFDHVAPNGARFEFAPWVMWTNFRARQNYAGNLETSQINPALSGLGDIFETINLETAAGVTSRFHTTTYEVGPADLSAEPGIYLRVGHTDQAKNLLAQNPQNPDTLLTWDRRIDVRLDQLDAGAYLDLDVRFWKRLRFSGGLRADLLVTSIDDRLVNVVPAATAQPGLQPGAVRGAAGIAWGPRMTVDYEVAPWLHPTLSYGEGFRSLDATHLADGSSLPFSKVRSFEGGFHAEAREGRYTGTFAAFQTEVGNELVFEALSGGLTTQNASTRRGLLGSLIASPTDWLLASSSLTVTHATFATQVAGVAHYVPNIPPVLLRADVAVRGRLADVRGKPVKGRASAGYTFLARRHLTDTIMEPAQNVLNAGLGVRYGSVELAIDGYNILGLHYGDDTQVYVSNWSLLPGQQPASLATHYVAAPPRTILGSLALYF